MTGCEVTSWYVVRAAEADMVDFRVHRTSNGVPHAYVIFAKRGDMQIRLVNFSTNGPLSNQLRDACINLVRCSS